MTAYRIATVQVNTPVATNEQTDTLSISTVVMGVDEIADSLDAEATLHAAAGWKVRASRRMVVAAKVRDGDTPLDAVLIVRVLYPVAFDPAQDGDPDIELRPVL